MIMAFVAFIATMGVGLYVMFKPPPTPTLPSSMVSTSAVEVEATIASGIDFFELGTRTPTPDSVSLSYWDVSTRTFTPTITPLPTLDATWLAATFVSSQPTPTPFLSPAILCTPDPSSDPCFPVWEGNTVGYFAARTLVPMEQVPTQPVYSHFVTWTPSPNAPTSTLDPNRTEFFNEYGSEASERGRRGVLRE